MNRDRKNPIALASAGLGLIVALSLVLLSTCQKGSSAGDGSGGGSEDATALSGEWATTCLSDTSKTGYYFVDARSFDGTTFSTTFVSYADEACETPLMTQTQIGAFVVGDPMEGVGATELDITIGSVTITLHTDALVQSYNAKTFCGGGWKKGEAKTISRQQCGGGSSTEPDMVFEIFATKGGSLYFGKKDAAHTGKAESQRPEAIDESRPFTRA